PSSPVRAPRLPEPGVMADHARRLVARALRRCRQLHGRRPGRALRVGGDPDVRLRGGRGPPRAQPRLRARPALPRTVPWAPLLHDALPAPDDDRARGGWLRPLDAADRPGATEPDLSLLAGRPVTVRWISDYRMAKAAIVGADVWQWTVLVFLIVLSGFAGLPPDPIRAARAMGASRWQIFRYVELPLRSEEHTSELQSR